MTNVSSTLAETGLTSEEIVRASRHLAVTGASVFEAVSGLSEEQWNFTPDSDTWSIADIMEHLVLLEGRVHGIIANMGNASPAEFGHALGETDDFIINQVPLRSVKVKAPPPVCPSKRWTGPEALAAWMASREKTMQLLGAPLLRGRVVLHPLMGPWDGYQWLLAVASHSARHAAQMRELKADPKFPVA